MDGEIAGISDNNRGDVLNEYVSTLANFDFAPLKICIASLDSCFTETTSLRFTLCPEDKYLRQR